MSYFKVDCFSCGLRLGQWRSGDDIARAHAIHSKIRCEYLETVKSLKFVYSCKRKASRPQAISDGEDDKTMKEEQYEPDDPSAVLKCDYCLDRIKDMTFIPCGHLTSCAVCSFAFNVCPICRTRIVSKQKTYY